MNTAWMRFAVGAALAMGMARRGKISRSATRPRRMNASKANLETQFTGSLLLEVSKQ